MIRKVKVKDNHKTISKDELESIPKILDSICDKTLKSLEAEGVFVFPNAVKQAEDIDEKEYILQKDGSNYKTGNIMGFLGCKDERLIINSRFGDAENDFFLQYILGRVLEIPNVVNQNTDASLDEKLFDYLVFLFPNYLRTAMQKGLFKVYTKEKYNNERMRGAIDVARHIKTNTPFLGKVAYNRNEFSYDNTLTELIRHTIEYISTKKYGKSILGLARDEVKAIIETTQNYRLADRRKIVEWNKRNPVRHAYYREYRKLQLLCLMILRHVRHNLGEGEKKIYGILFDGSWLWEEYMNSLIGDYFYHPRNKGKQGDRQPQQLFGGDDIKNQGLIYPDFISSKDTEKRIIVDAKYRPEANIGRNDYQQILSYMFRFDSKNGYFLYPKAPEDKEDNITMYLNEGTTFEGNVEPREDICVKKYGFTIPSGHSNYMDFAKAMEKAESDFIDEFRRKELNVKTDASESDKETAETSDEERKDEPVKETEEIVYTEEETDKKEDLPAPSMNDDFIEEILAD